MSVHVMIKRRWQVGDPGKLFPLMRSLNEKAREQKGYLSTEILRSSEKKENFLIVSRWESMDDWQNWLASQVRRDWQAKIDSLIGEKTFYEVYETVDETGGTRSGMR